MPSDAKQNRGNTIGSDETAKLDDVLIYLSDSEASRATKRRGERTKKIEKHFFSPVVDWRHTAHQLERIRIVLLPTEERKDLHCLSQPSIVSSKRPVVLAIRATQQIRTGQVRTKQVRTKTEQDTTEQNRTEQDRTGQDRTGQDRTEQSRTSISLPMDDCRLLPCCSTAHSTSYRSPHTYFLLLPTCLRAIYRLSYSCPSSAVSRQSGMERSSKRR